MQAARTAAPEVSAAQLEHRRALRAFCAQLEAEERPATHREVEAFSEAAGLPVLCRTIDFAAFAAYYAASLERQQVPFEPYNQVDAQRWRVTLRRAGDLYRL